VGNVGLLGEAGFAEVHLVVDHAREQPQATGVDHLFAGSGVQIAGDGFNATLLYAKIGMETSAFIDQFGVLDQPISGHGFLQGDGNGGK
jgi:hypothetical protein